MIKLRSAAARLRASPEFWYWLALTVVHFFLPLNVRGTDEAKFFSWAKTQSGIFRTVISNSSRILIDWLTYCSVRMPFVWRLVNPLVIIALEILLIRLLRLQSKRERLVLRTLNLFSFLMLSVIVSSMTCSLNYLWPFTALLFVWDTLLNQKEVQANRKMENRRRAKNALAFLAVLLACSMQQTAVLTIELLFVHLYLARTHQKTHRLPVLYLGAATLATAVLVYRSFFMPNARATFVPSSFPMFRELTFWQKLELRFSVTGHQLTALQRVDLPFDFLSPEFSASKTAFYLLMSDIFSLLPTLCFFAFLLWLLVQTMRRNTSLGQKALSCAPFSLALALFALQTFGQKTGLYQFLQPLNHMRGMEYLHHFSPWMDLLYLLLFVLMLLSAMQLAQGKEKRAAVVCALLLGAQTRLMMGFQSEIWVNSVRTYYIFVMAMIITAFLTRTPNEAVTYAQKKRL